MLTKAKGAVKTILFPTANIIVAIFLLSVFFIAGQSVIQTFGVASISALNNLIPQPPDYFLELYTHQSTPDKNKIQCYVDYYEHLLRVFPNLWDAYGMLGYCYHYLNNDPKAIRSLKIAIQNDPEYFWNYYNLAAIYINGSRYREASGLLQKGLSFPPLTSLKRMFTSQMVYQPLLEWDEQKTFSYEARHLKETYQASFFLVQLLNQYGDRKDTSGVMSKLKPELYAF